LLLLLGFTQCSKFSKLQKSQDVQEKYAGAVEFYDSKQYYKASVLLEEVIPLLRGSTQAEKAQFLFAWCHYKMRMLGTASYYFKNFT
jgi:outer membrane protein assembly factor BamD